MCKSTHIRQLDVPCVDDEGNSECWVRSWWQITGQDEVTSWRESGCSQTSLWAVRPRAGCPCCNLSHNLRGATSDLLSADTRSVSVNLGARLHTWRCRPLLFFSEYSWNRPVQQHKGGLKTLVSHFCTDTTDLVCSEAPPRQTVIVPDVIFGFCSTLIASSHQGHVAPSINK